MPQFNKVFNLFVDWHHTESRHKRNVDKKRKGSKFTNVELGRTEQLGLPHPRTLLTNKEVFRDVLDQKRLNYIESHLEKSLNTIYARLIDARKKQKDNEDVPNNNGKVKGSKISKEKHKNWLIRMSSPKQTKEVEKIEDIHPKKRVDYYRIFSLALHKVRPEQKETLAPVSKSALAYNASEKIKHLAMPRWPCQKYIRSPITDTRISYRINPAYKSIKSKGIKYLSRPQRRTEKYMLVEEEVSRIVSAAATMYEASEHTRELAQPRKLQKKNYPRSELEDGAILPVSRTALTYEATERILKLSQPRATPQMKANDPMTQKELAKRKLENRWYYEHVSPTALKHVANTYISKLAKPKVREDVIENDFKVKKSALKKPQKKKEKYYMSLATPLPRKSTQKFDIPKHVPA